MANKTELTDDMLDSLQEHYACDAEFCMEAAEEHLDKLPEKELIEIYNRVFED